MELYYFTLIGFYSYMSGAQVLPVSKQSLSGFLSDCAITNLQFHLLLLF